VVFVDEAAEEVVPLDRCGRDRGGGAARFWWSELERAVGPLTVVVSHVDAEGVFEVVAPDDEEPVEAVVSDRADEAFRVGVRLGRADWGVDDGDALASEHFVEGMAELAVSVVDQIADASELVGDREVARLLNGLRATRVRRRAGEVDSTGRELDEEVDVVTAEGERLDGEEVAGDDAGCLLAQEVPPGKPDSPWCRLEAGGEQDPSYCAG
jgi:hypothetical protein